MRPSLLLFGLAFCAALAGFEAIADGDLLSLRHNPFTRPPVLAPKPPPPPLAVLPAADEVELELSATMVSDNAPMAIVAGELLAIGDRIQGFELVRVLEGKAEFVRDGRRFTFEIDNGRKLEDLQ